MDGDDTIGAYWCGRYGRHLAFEDASYGDAGDDYLQGTYGDQRLYGGPGDDRVCFAATPEDSSTGHSILGGARSDGRQSTSRFRADVVTGVAMPFLTVLAAAAIGGLIAALISGDALAVLVALVAGPVVHVVAGAALLPPDPVPPRRAMDARVLVLAVGSAAVGLSYVLIGAWLVVIAVVVLVAAIAFAILALLSGA